MMMMGHNASSQVADLCECNIKQVDWSEQLPYLTWQTAYHKNNV